MNSNPGSIMSGFKAKAWNVQNTVRTLPNVICRMLTHKHPDGTPFWARVEFEDGETHFHENVAHWVKSEKLSGLGMTLKYLFHLLDAHDDLKVKGSADDARKLLAEHGISPVVAESVSAKDLAKQEVGVEGGKPGPGRGNKTGNNVARFKARANNVDYLAARIKRDHPDIAERIQAGEFRSIHAAAIAAGIAKPTITIRPTVEGFTKAIKKRLTPEQIKELVQNLSGA